MLQVEVDNVVPEQKGCALGKAVKFLKGLAQVSWRALERDAAIRSHRADLVDATVFSTNLKVEGQAGGLKMG